MNVLIIGGTRNLGHYLAESLLAHGQRVTLLNRGEDWRYGLEKREAEDALAEAWRDRRFPVTSLRLPMVASERDHFSRIHGYLLRLRDGGPLLLPEPPWLAVRHVDVRDVVAAIERLLASDAGLGNAYNVSPDETLALDAFLELLASMAGVSARLVRVDR